MTEGIKVVRERFIEQMGVISQGDGLTRIAGRLMGLTIFDGRPYLFGELAIELQVSWGSISTNARILEQIGIIEQFAKPGDRQDYCQLVDDPYVNILKGGARWHDQRRLAAPSTKPPTRCQNAAMPRWKHGLTISRSSTSRRWRR